MHACVLGWRHSLTGFRAGLSERGALARFGCHGERRARAYKGGLGAEPPAGSRGRAPGQGVRG